MSKCTDRTMRSYRSSVRCGGVHSVTANSDKQANLVMAIGKSGFQFGLYQSSQSAGPRFVAIQLDTLMHHVDWLNHPRILSVLTALDPYFCCLTLR